MGRAQTRAGERATSGGAYDTTPPRTDNWSLPCADSHTASAAYLSYGSSGRRKAARGLSERLHNRRAS
jgi:hypothetical protein